MMNTMSNNKLDINELEMVNGGGLWDAFVGPICKVVKCTAYVLGKEFENGFVPAFDPTNINLRPFIIF